MKTVHFLALVGFALSVGAPRVTAERGRAEDPTRNREEVRRDRQEIETFEEFMGVLDVTSTKKQRKEYLKLNLELHEAMVREVAQAETRAERARRQPDAKREYRRPGREKERDLSTAAGRHAWLSDLVKEAQDLVPGVAQWDPVALVRNREVLGEFLDVMLADLEAVDGAVVER